MAAPIFFFVSTLLLFGLEMERRVCEYGGVYGEQCLGHVAKSTV